MNTQEYSLVLKSSEPVGDRIPPAPLAPLFSSLPVAISQAILMAFEGRSTRTGRKPAWLVESSDVRFIGLSGERDAVLRFEAPEFGDAAVMFYQQAEFWPSRPDPHDTGFDLLTDVLSDIREENEDSVRFDLSLLQQIEEMGRSLNGTFQEIDIVGHPHRSSRATILDDSLVANAKRLYAETPDPQRARIVGTLDVMQGSTQSFVLELASGERVRGVSMTGDVTDLRRLFGQRVLVLGTVVYRPSGRPLRIEAEAILSGDQEAEIWSAVPKPIRRGFTAQEISQPQSSRSGAGAIFNQWPGDESEEDLLAALESMG